VKWQPVSRRRATRGGTARGQAAMTDAVGMRAGLIK
jgi:hypothetical protein